MFKTSPQTYALAKRIEESTKNLSETLEGLKKYTSDAIAQSNEEVFAAEEKKQQIEKEVAEQERVAKLDLELRLKKNEQEVLDSLVKKYNWIVLKKEEYNSLKDSATVNEKVIKEAVSKAEQTAAIKYSYERKALEAAHSIASAELKADVRSLQNDADNKVIELNRLNDMISRLQDTITEVANSSSKSVVQNIGK